MWGGREVDGLWSRIRLVGLSLWSWYVNVEVEEERGRSKGSKGSKVSSKIAVCRVSPLGRAPRLFEVFVFAPLPREYWGRGSPRSRLLALTTCTSVQRFAYLHTCSFGLDSIMAGAVRQPIDIPSLERYIDQTVPELKTPLDVKQVSLPH